MVALHAKQNGDRNEQLLKLYWNRAGVKRELKNLKKERYELLDRLKDQESAILRAKEQLDGLERLLVNPIAAANAMVYFQLRNVWRVSSQKLEQFSAELDLQRLKREKGLLQDAARAKRQRRLAAIRDNRTALAEERETANTQIQALEASLGELSPIIKLFRGRALRAQIESLKANESELSEQLSELEELDEKIEGEPLPEVDDLSIDSRRIINTAILALAQHLVVHFSANNLAVLARDAMTKTVADMRFGDRRECDRMVENIRTRIADLKEEGRLADFVKKRAAMLSKELKYTNDSDAAPSSFSTQIIMPSPNLEGEGRRSSDAPLSVNVVSDDYWDLSRYFR